MSGKIGISVLGPVTAMVLAAAGLIARPVSATGAEAQAMLPDYRRVDGIAGASGEQFLEPTPDNAFAGHYPLTRFLYIYCNKPPHRSLPPLEKEFLTLVLSRTGQRVVIKDGYVPLSADLAEEERAKLE